MRGRPFLIAACQSILIMSPKARAVVAVGCNKGGREDAIRKKVGYRVFERVVGLERWISNCRLPAPVFVSIEEEAEAEGKKTITRGKNRGQRASGT